MAADTIRPFLSPRSVAVIGASTSSDRVGYMMVQNLLSAPHPPRIFPVNPRGGEVLGLPAYRSLEDLPEPAELALIAVAPGTIPGVIEDCASHRVRAAIITTAGFAEGGGEGRRLQEGLVATARRGGLRLMGPNTQGTINLDARLPLLSIPFPAAAYSRPGPVSFVVQSALFPWEFLYHHPHIGLSKMIDLGNMCDVDHADCVEYLAEDGTLDPRQVKIPGIFVDYIVVDEGQMVAVKTPVAYLGESEAEVDAYLASEGSEPAATGEPVAAAALSVAESASGASARAASRISAPPVASI
jgi:acetyltransferase